MADKVKTIQNSPRPTDANRVRVFLGFINYYQKFISNLSVTLHPLNNLLRKEVKFKWTTECEAASVPKFEVISDSSKTRMWYKTKFRGDELKPK